MTIAVSTGVTSSYDRLALVILPTQSGVCSYIPLASHCAIVHV